MKDKIIGKLLKLRDKFEKLNLKNKHIVFSGIILIVSMVVMIAIFNTVSNNVSTKEQVISDFKLAINNEDVKLLSKIVRVDEEKVIYKELIPLMDYYKNKKNTLNNIAKDLRINNKSDILEIQNRKSIFGKKYYIDIKRVSVELKTNFDDTEVIINNKVYRSGEVIEGVIPGSYLSKYKLKTEFGDITGEEEVTIVTGDSIYIDVDAGNITLYSDYKDADVFIDGKNINKKVKEIVDFGPIPLNRDIKLYIEQSFPWGKIRSKTVSINNGGIIKIDIDMVNEQLMEEINLSLNTFFNSVFEALNENDSTLIQNADEDTKDKIYDDIFKKYLFFANNYKISDMNLNIEKSDFEYEDEIYKANVVVKINYDIYKKILPFIKENREEMFLVNLKYENNSWISVGIQKFNMYGESNL